MSNQKDPKDFLYEGERLDDLQRDGMYIIQNRSGSALVWMPSFCLHTQR